MKLSEHLQSWRAERPDEWTMDDFIRKAKALEGALQEIMSQHIESHEDAHVMQDIAKSVLNKQ